MVKIDKRIILEDILKEYSFGEFPNLGQNVPLKLFEDYNKKYSNSVNRDIFIEELCEIEDGLKEGKYSDSNVIPKFIPGTTASMPIYENAPSTLGESASNSYFSNPLGGLFNSTPKDNLISKTREEIFNDEEVFRKNIDYTRKFLDEVKIYLNQIIE